MPEQESWTVGRLLTWTAEYLKKSGSESARLDAEILLAEARGCERISLYTAFNDEVDEDTRRRFREYVKRRAAGEPVAYLIGRREFYSLSLNVSRDVLIPRPETEHLVVEALDCIERLGPRNRLIQVADVGTGSGAIALAVAKHSLQCHVTALDISDAALMIARANIEQLELAERVSVQKSDLLDDVPADTRFDLILSNPPYVSQSEWMTLRPDVKDHEPHLALVGGPSGTEIIERLVPQAADRLQPEGWLIMEISPMIESRVQDIIRDNGFFHPPTVQKDLSGLVRIVKSQRIK